MRSIQCEALLPNVPHGVLEIAEDAALKDVTASHLSSAGEP